MRIATWLVIVGAGLWSIALLVGPLLRPDLDPLAAHPEAYADGPWAVVMRAGYVGIAVSAAATAYLARAYPIAAMLLVVFAAGALVIALLPPTGGSDPGVALFPIARLAPLACFPAIGSISWRERRRGLVVLAGLVLLLFLPLVFGEPPFSGMLNRAADLAIGAWFVAFARTAVRTGASGTLPETHR